MDTKIKKSDWIFWSLIFLTAIAFVVMSFPNTEKVEAALTPQPMESPAPIYDVPLPAELQQHISRLCNDYDMDMPLVLAVIGQESNYKAEAVGDGGESIGLMQIQPRWQQARMDKLGVTDLINPLQNVTVGIDLLAELMGEGKDIEWALTAYNAGEAKADFNREVGIIGEYAESVLMLREEILK